MLDDGFGVEETQVIPTQASRPHLIPGFGSDDDTYDSDSTAVIDRETAETAPIPSSTAVISNDTADTTIVNSGRDDTVVIGSGTESNTGAGSDTGTGADTGTGTGYHSGAEAEGASEGRTGTELPPTPRPPRRGRSSRSRDNDVEE